MASLAAHKRSRLRHSLLKLARHDASSEKAEVDWNWDQHACLITIATKNTDGDSYGDLKLTKESAKALEKVFIHLDADGNGYLEKKDLESIAEKWEEVCKIFPTGKRITPELFVQGMTQYTLNCVPIGQVRDAPAPPLTCPRGGQGIALLSADIASRAHRTSR